MYGSHLIHIKMLATINDYNINTSTYSPINVDIVTIDDTSHFGAY